MAKSKKVPVLNPAKVGWRDLKKVLGPARAKPVWQQIQEAKRRGKRGHGHNPAEVRPGDRVRFRVIRSSSAKDKEAEIMAKKKGAKKQQLAAMPKAWREKWVKGVDKYVRKAVKEAVAQAIEMPAEWRKAWQRGVKGAAGRATGQPMKMPKAWREKWAGGALARGSTKKWREGISGYAEQPIAALATVQEMFTAEGLMDLGGIVGGITAGTVAPAYLLSLLGQEPTAITEALAGVGIGVAGSAVLGMAGQYRMGRLFLFATVGTIVGRMLLERLLPPAAGVGQVTPAVERAIREEIETALREEGLGVLTTEEVPLAGGTGIVSTEAMELEGLGQTKMDVEPF